MTQLRSIAAILVSAALGLTTLAEAQTAKEAAAKSEPGAAAGGKAQARKPGAAGGHATVPGSSKLTADECKRLGGKVYTAPDCAVTGTRCVIHHSTGDKRGVCINEVSSK
jgi:hypothetical protein